MGTRITKSRTFVREKVWKCSSCETKNLGRSTTCSNCGSPKEADETYEPVGHGEVKNPELLKVFSTGPNRTCPYCKADVRESWEICPSCGATRNEHQDEIGEPEPPPPPPQASKPVSQPLETPTHEDPEPPPPPFSNRSSILRTILLGSGAAALLTLLIWGGVVLFAPWETDATISGVRWSYHVNLLQRVVRHGSDWRGSMHVGAYNTRCERRQRGTEDCNPYECNCHDENYDCNCTSHDCNCRESCRTSCSDNGNGSETCTESCSETCDTCQECSTCTREVCSTCYHQCPVYDDWCEYDWDDWPVIDRATTSGTDLNVYPPPLQARGSDQRIESSTAFVVNFATPDGNRTYRPSNTQDYRRFSPGRWRIKTNRAGMVWPLRRL